MLCMVYLLICAWWLFALRAQLATAHRTEIAPISDMLSTATVSHKQILSLFNEAPLKSLCNARAPRQTQHVVLDSTENLFLTNANRKSVVSTRTHSAKCIWQRSMSNTWVCVKIVAGALRATYETYAPPLHGYLRRRRVVCRVLEPRTVFNSVT